MKKLLVLFVSAALVLSMAAVSLAAATFNGDFRYNMYEDESDPDDTSYGQTDVRLRVTGDLSDTVKASANFRGKQDSKTASWKTSIDEFYALANYFWGTAKMGYYEYNFTPSRHELTSAGKKNTPKCDATFEADIPITEELTFSGIVMPYEDKNDGKCIDDGSYAVSVGYKVENWGAKVSYWDLKANDYDLTAIDLYYMLNENMTIFVDAVDYSHNDDVNTSTLADNNEIRYDEGFDPVIGFAWSNIADTKLSASIEYAFNSRYDVAEDDDFNEYIITASYKLDNGIGLEFYHYVVSSENCKDMFRIRYKF
jgi:hypothetical protein